MQLKKAFLLQTSQNQQIHISNTVPFSSQHCTGSGIPYSGWVRNQQISLHKITTKELAKPLPALQYTHTAHTPQHAF
jgi:hypothetical protein